MTAITLIIKAILSFDKYETFLGFHNNKLFIKFLS